MKPNDKALKLFAAQVQGIAKIIAMQEDDRSFGPYKVFISAIREALSPRTSKQAFGDLLIEAQRRGFLRLERADLVAAMPAELVTGSEIAYLNATFHFVEI